ncbi:hypothetical protein RJT34_14317 [Clitoria ternatea]|uniref:Uncharacterized protein n=1 Tax=Clitoria ternatea TaxID=43366 RepID=A0AAN9PMB9_CLITE
MVSAAFEGFRVAICESDVSMDSSFKEELRVLLEGEEREQMVPPRVFMKGFYIDGVKEMLKVTEEGQALDLLKQRGTDAFSIAS